MGIFGPKMPEQPKPLAPDLAGALSVLAPTADGLSVAFSKLELADVPCGKWVEQLPRLTHITDLALDGCEMSDDDSRQLEKLELLTRLSLSRNTLTKIPFEVEFANSFLQVVNLSHNQLTDAGMDLAACCPMLHTLDLSHNSISSIKGLKCTSELKVMNLSSNQLTNLSGAEMFGLLQLNASDNLMEQLEDAQTQKLKKYHKAWVSAFENLEELNVEGNKLGMMTAEKGKDKGTVSKAAITGFLLKGAFPKLHTLKLGRNLIQDYKQLMNLADWWSHPEGLTVLPALRKLTLFKNPNTDPERVWEPPEPAEGEEPLPDPVAPFDEGAYPATVLCYLPNLTNLDAMPQKDEEGEMVADFATEEQHEAATAMRIELVTAEKEAKAAADAEAARIEAEKKAAEEEAARIAAEEAAAAAAEAALEAEDDDE